MELKWVTKFVSSKQWNEFYSYNPSYALIEKVRGGYKVGFAIITNELPIDTKEANEFDIQKIRKWRKENNIFPLPYIV